MGLKKMCSFVATFAMYMPAGLEAIPADADGVIARRCAGSSCDDGACGFCVEGWASRCVLCVRACSGSGHACATPGDRGSIGNAAIQMLDSADLRTKEWMGCGWHKFYSPDFDDVRGSPYSRMCRQPHGPAFPPIPRNMLDALRDIVLSAERLRALLSPWVDQHESRAHGGLVHVIPSQRYRSCDAVLRIAEGAGHRLFLIYSADWPECEADARWDRLAVYWVRGVDGIGRYPDHLALITYVLYILGGVLVDDEIQALIGMRRVFTRVSCPICCPWALIRHDLHRYLRRSAVRRLCFAS
jgi:hypothetical protein